MKIINVYPTAKPDLSADGECVNIHTDITYEFLFADTGFQGNPQRRLVGVEVKYGKAREHLSSKCFGLFCPPSQHDRVEITQVVSFVDVSRKPEAERKSTPRSKAKASNDFFYPFST